MACSSSSRAPKLTCKKRTGAPVSALTMRLACFGIGLAVSWVAVAASGTTGVGYLTYIALPSR